MTLVGTVWSPIGPSPISQGGRQDNGLVTAIAVNPNNGNIIYLGTGGGGVWRTLNGGTTWTPIFDRQLALGIGEPGAIAIDPSDTSILYVGTSGRVTPQAAAGLYKSTDGGASAVRLGFGYPAGNVGNARQFASQAVNVIIVDPANPQIVYLASSVGVYRSTDGGLNWVLGTGSNGDALSLVLDRSSPAGARILYAGVTGRGVFRSNDGGRNWALILGPATPQVVTAVGGTPGAGISKVVVDLAPPRSPPNPAGIQVIYVALSGSGGAPDPVGLFLSTDQGTTWAQPAATGMPTNTQGGYSFHMAVDPASPGDGVNDIVYVGCVGQARSANSGAGFTGLAGLHADTHAWAFFRPPAPAPSVVYCGNDGGIFRSTDNGTTWAALNGGGLQTGLFYNLAVKPDANATASLGALQDNGLQTTAGAASPFWNSPQGGDGWDIAFDGVTPGRVYGTSGFWDPAPCTRVFRSDDDGASWPSSAEITPWGTATDQGCYLSSVACDPSAAGIVYASGNQNMWQSRNAGASWRNLGPFPGNASVAPSNGNNVVVASGQRVFVTTNALAATVGAPNGVTFTDITRNLPARNVQRAAFDPNDPSVIYAVLGGFDGAGPGQRGHVFRTTVAGTAWQDISPAVNIPHGGLALDGSDTPTTLYVGNDFGVLRSVDDGATWTVLDDIHFPHAPVTDLVLSRSGGLLRAATYGRGVFEFRRPAWPSLAVNLEAGLNFGTVCTGPQTLTLQLFNVGVGDLLITSVQRLMGSTGFSVLPSPGTPVFLPAGEEIDFTIQYVPTLPAGPEMATIRIISNDPGAPIVDLAATGTGGISSLEVAIADDGDFGNVCLGSFVDRPLVINNRGTCPLRITGLTSSSPTFVPPRVSTFPLMVEAGASIDLPIRFQPAAVGAAAASLTITSNDPASPETVRVRGNTPAPRLALSIADAGSFGDVCIGSFRDEPLTLANSGGCPLTVTGILSSSAEFVLPRVDAFPLRIEPGDAVDVQIRFEPVSFGPKSATLTIASDDPGGARTLDVSGFVPSGTLSVSGTGHFGPIEFGRRSERTISICNVGKCDLHVLHVGFLAEPWKPGCHDCDGCDEGPAPGEAGPTKSDQCCATFKIVSNPFPATLKAGSCLPVLIRFTPDCFGPKCCELSIKTDDPEKPEEIVYVTGSLLHTLAAALQCWAAEELQTLLKAGKRC